MIVKRISYFTFMVAITTIATVSTCSRAKGNPVQSFSFEESLAAQASALFLEKSDGDLFAAESYSIEIARVLREKGLKNGKIKIRTHNNGRENVVSIYLVFNKDYKGHVSARIFDSRHEQYDIPVIAMASSAKHRYADISADKREAIAQKNRILLE